MSPVTPAFVTYVINMDSATERMAHMDAELKRVAIPYIRQPGMVGMELPYPTKTFRTGLTNICMAGVGRPESWAAISAIFSACVTSCKRMRPMP